MRPEISAVASRNGGVFTRRDAVRCGYTERELKTATAHRGRWVVVRRGCYAERHVWEGLDEDGRYLMRVRAAVLNGRADVVVSHTSAAVLLGMPVRPHWRDLVHVTPFSGRAPRTASSITAPPLLPRTWWT